MKKIGDDLGIDDLEFYAARHTWATIASNEAGVDKYTVHTALNHVDENMRVTDIYIAKSWDSIDAANRKVLDYVKLSLDDVTEKKYIPKINVFCLSKICNILYFNGLQTYFCLGKILIGVCLSFKCVL